ncbi:MAG: MBL fold metallo-hydrolase [Clostridia bacterium]|nr:MBL fold metallo-hydrolase [Clostridia bacterium]
MKQFFSVLLALCLLLSVLPAQAQVYVKQDPPEDWQQRDLLRITVFRTGEGDCMLLEAGGECMMIDGGPYKYREKLRDALNDRGITHFKYLFSTHPHDDHIDGLRMLMTYGFEVDEFLSVFPKDVKDTEGNQKKAMNALDKAGIPYRQLENGSVLTLGGAELTVFFWAEGFSMNAQSGAAKLVFGDCSALFTADITGDTQKYFLETLGAEFLKVDVVKAPHHGITPMVGDFLTAVDPGYIWCTNYHGDRVEKTQNQATYRKIPIQFSGDGTIVLECDGTDWYINQTLYEF